MDDDTAIVRAAAGGVIDVIQDGQPDHDLDSAGTWNAIRIVVVGPGSNGAPSYAQIANGAPNIGSTKSGQGISLGVTAALDPTDVLTFAITEMSGKVLHTWTWSNGQPRHMFSIYSDFIPMPHTPGWYRLAIDLNGVPADVRYIQVTN